MAKTNQQMLTENSLLIYIFFEMRSRDNLFQRKLSASQTTIRLNQVKIIG